MKQRIHSFSVPMTDVKTSLLVDEIKSIARDAKVPFSDIVVQALKLYHKEVLCQKTQN